MIPDNVLVLLFLLEETSPCTLSYSSPHRLIKGVLSRLFRFLIVLHYSCSSTGDRFACGKLILKLDKVSIFFLLSKTMIRLMSIMSLLRILLLSLRISFNFSKASYLRYLYTAEIHLSPGLSSPRCRNGVLLSLAKRSYLCDW